MPNYNIQSELIARLEARAEFYAGLGRSREFEAPAHAEHADLLRQASATLQSAEARARELEARVEEALKFIDDYFAPWGSWKTAWWEDQVSDSAVFCGDNALRAVEKKLRAPHQADERA